MATILRQRDIIDRRTLAEELAQAIADSSAPALDRRGLLPPLKAALARGRAEIRRRFDADGTRERSGCALRFREWGPCRRPWPRA